MMEIDVDDGDVKVDYAQICNDHEPESICRMCLGTTSITDNVLDRTIVAQMESCIGGHITSGPGLPTGVCETCLSDLRNAYAFRSRCLNTEETLKTYCYQKLKVKVETEECAHVEPPMFQDGNDVKDETAVKHELDVDVECDVTYDEGDNTEGGSVKDEGRRSTKKYKCDTCQKPLSSKHSLRLHIQSFHMDNKRQHLESTGWGKTRIFLCKECPYTTRYSQSLVYHTRTHTGEKPYKCDVCDTRFSQPGSLSTHKKTHSDKTYYTCDECGKQFKHKDTYRGHMKVHSTVAEYSCKVCGKGLKSRTTLESHTRRHFNIRNYACETCGALFVSRVELVNHAKKHGRKEKKFMCNLCDFGAYAKKNLDSHLRRHTGEKPFKCDLCDTSWYTKGELKSHRIKHTKEKNYSCPVCELKFAHSTSVNKHALKIHGIKYNRLDVDRRLVK